MAIASQLLDERVSMLLGSDPDTMQDPYPLLAELRGKAPVLRLGKYILVSSYDDVRAVLLDARRFGNCSMEEGTARVLDARATLTQDQIPKFDEFVSMERGMTFMADSDEHLRRRRQTVHLFTPVRIRQLEELTQQYIDELFDAVAGKGVVDLAPATAKLPGWIIANLLGLPREDSALLVEWGDAINKNLHRSTHIDGAYAALEQVYAYVHEIVEERGGEATPLLSAIVEAASSGDERRLRSMFVEMQIGGYETTRGLLGGGVVVLMRQRDQWERLVARPDLAENAAEELLRLVSPALWTARVPMGATEIGGVRVNAEDTVLVILGAANRDPDVFEDPDRADLSRENARQHLAFSFGAHYCLGQALARLEGRLFFRSLAERFPDLELVGDVRWVGNANNPNLESLKVSLGA